MRGQLSLDLPAGAPDDLGAGLDLSDERPLVGLSGGVNSAALLVYLGAEAAPEHRPRSVCLFHADLAEHPPDVPRFVAALVRWARRVWGPRNVAFGRARGSVLALFEADRWVPHPAFSPCTGRLKLEPMERWAASLAEPPTVDLVGYVREERRRIARMEEKGRSLSGGQIRYPIAHLTDADCFRLVDGHVGWHPRIYDLRDERGRPAFRHANCLPCKNMNGRQLAQVERHFPEHMARARAAAERITAARGEPVYFGRPTDYEGDPCAVCAFG